MTKIEQRTAVLSKLQAVDFMNAVLLVRSPSILFVGEQHAHHTIQWNVAGVDRSIEFTTLYRAALTSGIVAMRSIVEFLGVTAPKPQGDSLPLLTNKKQVQPVPGGDLQASQICGARSLTTEMLKSDTLKCFVIRRPEKQTWTLEQSLTYALRAASTYVSHMVWPDTSSELLDGDAVTAGILTCVLTQELVLQPAFDSGFDNVVFDNSTQVLSNRLAAEYISYRDTLRADLRKVLTELTTSS